ncbi:hypothetical protein V1527DRAFT_459630, partial [Lipomyces starkeyi]
MTFNIQLALLYCVPTLLQTHESACSWGPRLRCRQLLPVRNKPLSDRIGACFARCDCIDCTLTPTLSQCQALDC